MSELAEDTELRNMKWAVALYTLVFLMKLVGFFFTGVMVLLADALHNLSDVVVYSSLLIAAIWSEKEANEAYRLGYGRAQNVAALIAGTLFITFTSYKLYREAVPKLLNPEAVTAHNFNLALGIMGVTMVLIAIPLFKLWRQETRSAAARAQALDILNDELSSVAVIVGTLFLMWDVPIVDPIATMVVATLIGINGLRLVKDNMVVLVGRSPDEEFLEKVKKAAKAVEGVKGVHELRAEYVGPEKIHLGMHVEVDPDLPVEEASGIVDQVKENVHESTSSEGAYCYVHVDPLQP